MDFKDVHKMINSRQNQVFDYLKFMLFGTEDKDIISQKEKALESLFEAMNEMSNKKLDRASQMIKKSIDIFSNTRDHLSKAFAEYFMGEVCLLNEQIEKAKEFYQSSYKVFKEKGNMMALRIEKKLLEIEEDLKKKPL